MLDKLNLWDTELFVYLNSLHTPGFDNVMWYISGKLTWIPLYAIILFFVFKQYRWKGFAVVAFVGLLVAMTDLSSVHLFKNIFQRFRPTHNPDLADFVHTVNNYRGGKYGFVSSHATNTLGLAVFTSLLFKTRFFTVWMIAWALIVSYSRIYLGVHYPGDILCGALLGVACGFIAYKLLVVTFKKLEWEYNGRF